MNLSNIPVGYQLHVTSWENDADDYQTKVMSGLSEDDVKFLLSIARRFKSRNSGIGESGAEGLMELGNGSVSNEKLTRILEIANQEYPNVSEHIRKKFIVDPTHKYASSKAFEAISDLLHWPINEMYCDLGNFCRVFDEYKVYYYPAAIEDVSGRFA